MEQVSKNDYKNCTLNFPDQEPNLILVNKSPQMSPTHNCLPHSLIAHTLPPKTTS